MILPQPHRLKKNGVWLLGLLAAAFSSAAAASCVESSASGAAAYVDNWSEWREFNIAGRNLVRETGSLQGVELSAEYRCDKWHLAAQIAQLNGTRIYDGQTNNGAPVISQSGIRQQQGHIQVMRNVTENWQLGSRLSGQTLWRDIASVGVAAGYPERFDWTLLSLGAQWQTRLGPGQLTMQAWAGQQQQSSMALTLPGRDPMSLTLGAISQTELAAGWRTQLSPAWHLQIDLGYRRTEMEQGSPSVIRRGGLPVGVAYQPRTVMEDRPMSVRVGYDF